MRILTKVMGIFIYFLYFLNDMRKYYLFILILILSVLLIGGCTTPKEALPADETLQPAEIPAPDTSDLQCPKCPFVCLNEDGTTHDDTDEAGSCACTEEDGVCKRIIKQLVYTAPDIKPEKFLGQHIGKVSNSDWMNYEPLKQKVQEVTQGLDTDSEKSEAIARYVSQSKKYASALPNVVLSTEETNKMSPANSGGTIIDIFNSEQGVCLDSAYLATAMMRLAGIPAMAVSPSSREDVLTRHEIVYVYVNNKWMMIDPTFGDGALPSDLTPWSLELHDYSEVAGGKYDMAFASSYICSDQYIENSEFKHINPSSQFNYFLDIPVTLNKYGRTSIPVMGNKYSDLWEYLSPSSDKYIKIYTPHRSNSDSHYNIKLYWDENYVIEENYCGADHYIYDYKYNLPMAVGTYKVRYQGSRGIPEEWKQQGRNEEEWVDVAILTFEIQENQETVLTNNNFEKALGATDEEYAHFLNYVNKILSYS